MRILCVGGLADGRWYEADDVELRHDATFEMPEPIVDMSAPVSINLVDAEEVVMRSEVYKLRQFTMDEHRCWIAAPLNTSTLDMFESLLRGYRGKE